MAPVLARCAPTLVLGRLPLRGDALGLAGERVAERWLARRGLRPRARRLRTRHGELDLVLEDGRTLACVEVKTGRAGPRHVPGERVDRARLERLWRAAEEVGRRARRPVRVDLVEVRLDRRGRPGTILHHRGLRTPVRPSPHRRDAPGGFSSAALPPAGREPMR